MSNLYEIDVVTATPLPASWTMMLLGLGALGVAKHRHAKKAACGAQRRVRMKLPKLFKI